MKKLLKSFLTNIFEYSPTYLVKDNILKYFMCAYELFLINLFKYNPI